MAESTLLEDAGPNGRLLFSVVPENDTGEPIDAKPPFEPAYYPDRFNRVMDKELNRDGQQCAGENVSIDTFKNAEIHATGVCLANKMPILETLSSHDGKVDLITPISPNGGLKAYVKKAEFGELSGWSPVKEQWMFNYTLDFVSTGLDEHQNGNFNPIVTSLLDGNSDPYADKCTFTTKGAYTYLRKDAKKRDGTNPNGFKEWQNCSISTKEFRERNSDGELRELNDIVLFYVNDRLNE